MQCLYGSTEAIKTVYVLGQHGLHTPFKHNEDTSVTTKYVSLPIGVRTDLGEVGELLLNCAHKNKLTAGVSRRQNYETLTLT